MKFDIHNLVIDIELSSHCNANCYFCPRDSVPFLKHMDADLFNATLDRLSVLPSLPRICFCGTGDSTMNPHIGHFVRNAVERGFEIELVTNGILVEKNLALELINSGLQKICFSITETGAAYESIYNFPFNSIVDNVVRFHQLAQGKCVARISYIGGLTSERRIEKLKNFWRKKGIQEFLRLDYTNRAGLNHLVPVNIDQGVIVAAHRESGGIGMCPVPFKFLHIGADGTYYLCSHDFARRVSFGNVLTDSLSESLSRKLDFFKGEISFCKSCTNYPANQFYSAVNSGDTKKFDLQDWGMVENNIISTVDALLEESLVIRQDSPT